MTDYPTYVTQLETMIPMDPSDADFQNIIPVAITYAEMRIYRELDLLSTYTLDTTTLTTQFTPNVAIPNTFVVAKAINVLTPAASPVTTAARNQLIPASPELLWSLWGDPSVTGQPVMYCFTDQWDLLLAPTPDNVYNLEVYGTQRPAPLSATNTTTFLTTWLYDLFFAASMIFIAGYMRNFGAQSGDPQMSSSWEAQYKTLKESANVEELRKKQQADSWTANGPTPAQPPRG